MNTVLSPDTTGNREDERMTPGKKVYIILSGFLLISYLLAAAIGFDKNMIVIWILRCITVPMSVYYGKLWKDKGFCLLICYFLWFFSRLFISNPNAIFSDEVAPQILGGIWVFTNCYSIGHALSEKQLSRLLKACIRIWTVGIVIYSIIGIYAAWTDQRILTLRDEYYAFLQQPITETMESAYFGFWGNRLMMATWSTASAAILGISILIALCRAICCRKRIEKITMLAATAPMLLAMALTDTRTSFISVSAGVGIIIFVGIFRFYETRKKNGKTKGHPWYIWILASGAMAVTALVLLLGILQITPQFNQIKLRGIFPSAYAEGTGGNVAVSARGFNWTKSMFTGRVEIWESFFQCFREKPLLFLTGTSKYQTMARINELRNYHYAHCHNMIFQILLESGIPGLLLVLLFLIYIGYNAVKLLKSADIPFWIRLFPAFVFSLWIADLDECLVWLGSVIWPMIAFQFVAFGVIIGNCKRVTTHQRILRQ